MLRFPQYVKHGVDRDLMNAVVREDIDKKVLSAILGREFVARLANAIGEGAGLHLDLRFKSVVPSEAGAMRFLRMTGTAEDVRTIYRWNVSRIDPCQHLTPPAVEDLNEWDRGSCLDSIVRRLPQGETYGNTIYGKVFRDMGGDGFIEKAMLIAMRHFDMFPAARDTDERSLH